MDGNPRYAWDKIAKFLRSVAFSLRRRPQAILLISAHTYQLRYDAAGNNPERGYDHGAFILPKVMFPETTIPITQMSLRSELAPRRISTSDARLRSGHKPPSSPLPPGRVAKNL